MATVSKKQSIVALALALGLAAALAMAFTSVSTAWADPSSSYLENPGKTLRLFYYPKWENGNSKPLTGDFSMDNKVTKVKSSKKSVFTAKGFNNEYGGYIFLYLKKSGQATLSYKYKGETHKVTVDIRNYSNPLSTFKVGSVDVLSRFNKKSEASVKLDSAGKLKLKAKSGWKITNIKKDTNKAEGFAIGNGSKIGTNTEMVVLNLKNTKTKFKLEMTLFTDFV